MAVTPSVVWSKDLRSTRNSQACSFYWNTSKIQLNKVISLQNSELLYGSTWSFHCCSADDSTCRKVDVTVPVWQVGTVILSVVWRFVIRENRKRISCPFSQVACMFLIWGMTKGLILPSHIHCNLPEISVVVFKVKVPVWYKIKGQN